MERQLAAQRRRRRGLPEEERPEGVRRERGPLPHTRLDVEAEGHVQRDGVRVQVLQSVQKVGQESRGAQEEIIYAGAQTCV